MEKGPLLARGAGAAVLATVAAPLAALAAMIAPSHETDNACAGLIAEMRKPAKAPPVKVHRQIVAGCRLPEDDLILLVIPGQPNPE